MSRLIFAALLVALVAACGLRGNLDVPPPMGNGETRQKYDEAQSRGEVLRPRNVRPGAENTPGIGSGGAQGNDAVRVPDF